jgi:hypothetical protein
MIVFKNIDVGLACQYGGITYSFEIILLFNNLAFVGSSSVALYFGFL